jgi:phage terminase Nu1 subunit (DNA packaging protein)
MKELYEQEIDSLNNEITEAHNKYNALSLKNA